MPTAGENRTGYASIEYGGLQNSVKHNNLTSFLSLFGILVTVILGGCATDTVVPGSRKAVVVSAADPQTQVRDGMTRDELKLQVMRFADRYATRINQATDMIIDEAQTPAQRASAHRFKVISFTAVVDIAIGPDAVTNLLDAMVLASLTHITVEDYYVPQVFGKQNSQQLLQATRVLEEDIWGVADKVLTAEEQNDLRALLAEWRRQHPDQHYIWGIRFGQFSGQRAAALEQVVSSGGLLGQFKQTRESIDEVRDLGERTLFYVQRAALLARWQAVGGLYDVLSQPEIQSLLKDTERVSASVERLTLTIDELHEKRLEVIDQMMDRISEERAAFMEQLFDNEEKATKVLTELHGALFASSELIGRVNILMDKLPEPDNSNEPLDLQEVRQIIRDTAITSTQLTALVGSVEGLVAAPAWEQRLPDAMRVVDMVGNDIHGMLLRIFIFTVATIVIFFASLLGYRALLPRLTKQSVMLERRD